MPFTISHQNMGCYGRSQPSCGFGIETHHLLWGFGASDLPNLELSAPHRIEWWAWCLGLVISIRCLKAMTQHCSLDFEFRVNQACRLKVIWKVSSEPPTAFWVFCIVSIAPLYGIFRTYQPAALNHNMLKALAVIRCGGCHPSFPIQSSGHSSWPTRYLTTIKLIFRTVFGLYPILTWVL